MKKLLTTLWVAWMLAWSPSANAQIDSTRVETNEDLVEVMSKQNKSSEEAKTISFEDAKDLQEQLLFEELLEVERFHELVNEYGEEQVREALKELLSSEETEEVVKYLLSDQKIQRALEKWDWDALSQRMLHILRVYYGANMISKISLTILSILFFMYSIRDLKWWHYVIGKKR